MTRVSVALCDNTPCLSPPGGERLLCCPQSNGLHRLRHRDRPDLCLAGLVSLGLWSLLWLAAAAVDVAFVSRSLSSLSQSQHGRLQAGEAERGHQTSGHRHHLHRSVTATVSPSLLAGEVKIY